MAALVTMYVVLWLPRLERIQAAELAARRAARAATRVAARQQEHPEEA